MIRSIFTVKYILYWQSFTFSPAPWQILYEIRFLYSFNFTLFFSICQISRDFLLLFLVIPVPFHLQSPFAALASLHFPLAILEKENPFQEQPLHQYTPYLPY